ncbi:MAG: hypothetical protein NVSMB25_02340 [Thermoleophilaceae bacterium]
MTPLGGALRPDKAAGLRLKQGAALLAGGVAVELLLGLGPVDFLATPLALGLAYMAAAALGGRRGGYWATAVVLVGFGAAVVILDALSPNTPLSLDYAIGSVVGIAAGIALTRLGFEVGLVALLATALGAGAIFGLESLVSGQFSQDHIFAAALAIVGAFNLAVGTRNALGQHRQATEEGPTTPPSSGGASRAA